jgi:alpha-L-fucosidase
MDRRSFICTLAAGPLPARPPVPWYLKGYEKRYEENPRRAALDWFRDARSGLFMHYGLYSLLGRGEWVMLREKIPVADYAKLKDRFTAARFDAGFITDLALQARMKYVNLTSKHHDGFCLFRTRETDFNSVNSPARRDLVGELARACRQKGLGLFLYYSLAADWRHPYFYAREVGWESARPAYEKPEPTYLWRKDEDFQIYLRFAHNQLRELLTQYGPLAGIWLDPIMGYYRRPDLFPISETYALVRSMQPQCLISFKQGANGEEDFVAPERGMAAHRFQGEVARAAWEKNRGKHGEICETLQARVWGYNRAEDGSHKSADQVMKMLENARAAGANLLLNTGPLGDGSIHPEDAATLRETGRRTGGARPA